MQLKDQNVSLEIKHIPATNYILTETLGIRIGIFETINIIKSDLRFELKIMQDVKTD